jgi:cellobiose-specific phosphotransferase system component IIA
MMDYLAEARKALQKAKEVKIERDTNLLVKEAQTLINAHLEAFKFSAKPLYGGSYDRVLVDE